VSRLHALMAAVVVLSCLGCAQHAQRHADGIAATASTPSITLTDKVVDVGCAQCMFGLDLPDCETAIRVDGVIFMATGQDVPDAEDHETGVCRTIKRARVSGQTVGPRFVATSFVLLD